MKLFNKRPDRRHQHRYENGSLTGPIDETITREMVCARTLELTSMAGRSPHQIRQVDYERAKRELAGESDSTRQQAGMQDS